MNFKKEKELLELDAVVWRHQPTRLLLHYRTNLQDNEKCVSRTKW